MEGWMVSVTISIVSFIVTFAAAFGVLKYRANESKKKDEDQDEKIDILLKFMNTNTPVLVHFNKVEEAYGKKLDHSLKNITELQQQITQTPTMREVRTEFMSKEIFRQFEKHIDKRFDSFEKKFDTLADGQSEILSELRSKSA